MEVGFSTEANSIMLLMRHGECTDAATNPDAHAHPEACLSPTGRAQVVDALRDLTSSVSIILSSPLIRALETAEIASQSLAAPIRIIDSLTEWKVPTCVLGLQPSEYPESYLNWRKERLVNPESTLDDGESLDALWRRARSTIRSFRLEYGDCSSVLVISHLVFLRMLMVAIQFSNLLPSTAFLQAQARSWKHGEICLIEPWREINEQITA
jgi:probable phosphoglycerate mutase